MPTAGITYRWRPQPSDSRFYPITYLKRQPHGYHESSPAALHVLTAAAWFGLGLRLGGQARTALDAPGEAALALSRDVGRTVNLMSTLILLTFLFSMMVLGLGGGYAGQLQYHIASTLIVLLTVVQLWLIRPAWKGLHRALESGGDGARHARRLAMATGIGHLLWLVILVLMFWNRFAAVW